MKDNQELKEIEKKSPEGVEEDYHQHEANPAPSEEAVVEKNEDGAGPAMKWIIPILLIVLFIAYLIIKE